MTSRRRLAVELVRRRLVADVEEAGSLLDADRVLVNGAVADTLDRLVATEDALTITDVARFVGRGGEKLDRALDDFAVDVAGRRWLDAGASTGGFTDCLLQRGATHVVALDVGHGHLHPTLRADPRVTVLERTNVRHADTATIHGPVDGVVADLSFISLTTVLGSLVALCKPCAPMVLLVKPQFEASKAEVSAGRGVITDPAIHHRVRETIAAALTEVGVTVLGWVTSNVTGANGNLELFVHGRTPNPDTSEGDR